MTESEWTPAVGAITLVVADLEASKSFYSSVFASPLIFQNEDSAVFRFGPTVLNLLSELRRIGAANGWIPLQRSFRSLLG